MLISQMLRASAITGNPDAVDASPLLGRQGGRWANQWAHQAYGAAVRPAADPAASLEALSTLRAQGVITDEELAAVRARLAPRS